jgi:NADPH:quinone reductase-like Zn-dependent oxidoreductase
MPVRRISCYITASHHNFFLEYTVAPAHTSFHIGSNTSFQDAATLPLASMTACIGLFRFLQLSEPPIKPFSESRKEQAILINGASSTVGGYAVQLAKLAGYTVIGIAGQACKHAQKLGADHVIDYRGKTDEEIAGLVKATLETAGSQLTAVFDAVSSEATASMLVDHVMQPEGGKIANVLTMFGGEGVLPKPDNIEAARVRVRTAYGEHSEFASKWFRQISKWVDEGVFKPAPCKVMPMGLDSVQEGMQLLREGKVSAQKLVYYIKDTKSL